MTTVTLHFLLQPVRQKIARMSNLATTPPTIITWEEEAIQRSARWRSESGVLPPKKIIIADDRLTADQAHRLASEGTAMLWHGDFQNARQLLQALARRIDRKPLKPCNTPLEAFNQHRLRQSQRARLLGMVLIPFEAEHHIPLRRAPDVKAACEAAYGPSDELAISSLRELLGLIGAYEWRKKGVFIPALGEKIHPHYGVFAPVRGEYVDLVKQAPLPKTQHAFDIGTGTGVLAAVLAQRGLTHITATDQDPRAISCATENLSRLGFNKQVTLLQTDLFPEGKAGLIVCNPPWLPARPSSAFEYAVYDPDSRMLLGFLNGVADHLEPAGEAWLIISDLAEHLGLRTKDYLLNAIKNAGLQVIDRLDVKPQHPKASDENDPLHTARAAEITSLWRLGLV